MYFRALVGVLLNFHMKKSLHYYCCLEVPYFEGYVVVKAKGSVLDFQPSLTD